MKRFLSIVVGTIAFAAVLLFSVLRVSMSSPGVEFTVSELENELAIHFDAQLRPYVDASSLDDALLAEGWLHARYRLWQMELLRRAGGGRLAEGLGESMLDTDISLWRAGVPQLAMSLEEHATPTTLARVDAYLAGVNAGLASYRIPPPEFLLTGIDPEPWTRRDVFAVGAIIAFQSANNLQKELLRLSLLAVLEPGLYEVFEADETRNPGFPFVLKEHELMVLRAFADSLDASNRSLLPSASLGSSGWAVGPSRSASGSALFAFDSHDTLSLPNLFFDVHLFYGPGKSIRGWSLPGLPGVINGFNQDIAWGLTNIGDTQDLFVETRHPEDPLMFEFDGKWHRAAAETVDIEVKGRVAPEQLTIIRTGNGPLISVDPPISLRWTGHETAGRGLEGLFAMNTAGNWSAFEAAINAHAAPSANITYADRGGTIAFRTIGLLPVRGVGNGLVPRIGNRADHQWTGYVDDAELPVLVDPEIGYVAAANARVHDGEPLVSADNAAGYRIRRLHSVLESDGEFDVEDMRRLQLDTFNSQAAVLLPFMLPPRQALSGNAGGAAMDVLRSWAAVPLNDADSAGALIWEAWYPELARSLFAETLGEPLMGQLLAQGYVLNHAVDRLVADDPDSPWWQGRRNEILRESFDRAVTALAAQYGDDPLSWRWDAAHSVSFRHELHGLSPLLDNWLSRGPIPWLGGHPVLARARYGYDRPFEGRAGATVRVVAEMGDRIRAQAVIPGGQHGHPMSRHYDDQLDAWLAGDLFELKNSPIEVEGAVTVLRPE